MTEDIEEDFSFLIEDAAVAGAQQSQGGGQLFPNELATSSLSALDISKRALASAIERKAPETTIRTLTQAVEHAKSRAEILQYVPTKHFDWAEEDDGTDELPSLELTLKELVQAVETVPVEQKGATRGESGEPTRLGVHTSRAALVEALSAMGTAAYETGGAVYMTETGKPITPEMMTAYATMLKSKEFKVFKSGLTGTAKGRIAKNLAFLPIPTGQLDDMNWPAKRPPNKAWSVALTAWGIKVLEPTLVPESRDTQVTITSIFGDESTVLFETPYWFLEDEESIEALSKPAAKPGSGLAYPTFYQTLFVKTAELSVLRTALSMAGTWMARGDMAMGEVYKKLRTIALEYVYGNGSINGLCGRLQTTFALAERRQKAPPGFTGEWRKGAFNGDYGKYRAIMSQMLPSLPQTAFTVLDDMVQNLEAMTGVNLVTGTVVDDPAVPAMIKLSAKSESGVMNNHKPKGETFLEDIVAATNIINFFMKKLTREEKLKVCRVLSLVNGKSKAEVGTVVKSGVHPAPTAAEGLASYGPTASPGAKWRFIYPVNASVNYILSVFLAPLFKDVAPNGAAWQTTFINAFTGGTGVSLLGWSPFKGGMETLVLTSVTRREGFYVYSDNLYYYHHQEEVDGESYLRLVSLDVKSMESTITQTDMAYMFRWIAETVWGVIITMDPRTREYTLDCTKSKLSPGVANFVVNFAHEIIVDPIVVLGNLQFRLPGEPSGHQATAYMNTFKLAGALSTWLIRNHGVVKGQGLLSPVDSEADLKPDFIQDMRINGLELTVEADVQLPISEGAIQELEGEVIETDLLGFDLKITRLPSGQTRLAPVLNEGRRLRALAFIKSGLKGAGGGADPASSATANAFITLAKVTSLYLAGGWSSPAEASLMSAMITNAREQIGNLLGVTSSAVLYTAIREVMDQLAIEDPADSLINDLAMTMRTMSVPNAYDVVKLLFGEGDASVELVAFRDTLMGSLKGSGPGAQKRAFIDLVHFAGLNRAMTVEAPESWTDPDITKVLELLPRIREGEKLENIGETIDGLTPDETNTVVALLGSVESELFDDLFSTPLPSQDPAAEITKEIAVKALPAGKRGGLREAVRAAFRQGAEEHGPAIVIKKVEKVTKQKEKTVDAKADMLKREGEEMRQSAETWQRMKSADKVKAKKHARAFISKLEAALGPIDAQYVRTLPVKGASISEGKLAAATHQLVADLANAQKASGVYTVNYNAYKEVLSKDGGLTPRALGDGVVEWIGKRRSLFKKAIG